MDDNSTTKGKQLQGHDNKFVFDSNIIWSSADNKFLLAWQQNIGVPA